MSANTTYTFLPYAITADGAVHYCNPKNTIDGNCVQLNSAPTNVFTTKTGTKTLPSTELNSIFNKMVGSVGVQYKLTSNGNDKVTDFGICYGTDPNPTTSDSVLRDTTRHLEATVYIDITGLDPETEYYFRAFATNSVGTAYSNEKNEETVKDLVITTLTPTVTANNSVSCGGEITTESVITERGVCYGLYKNPTISNSTKLSETNTSGKYNVVISEGLTVNKTYYIKAYCKSGGQTYYGLESSFITNADTKPSLAVIETLQSPVVKTNTIDASVRVVNNGSSGIKELGAIVTTTTNPTTLNTYVGKVTMNSGETKVISNLNDDTTYYLTAYAINNNDSLSFGSSIEFTTLEVVTQDFEVNYGANWDKTNKLLKLTILVDNETIDSYSFKYTTSYSNLISGTNLTVIESTNNVIDIDFKFLTQTTRIFGYTYATNESAVECRNLYVIDLTLDVDGNVVVITDPAISTDKFNPPKNSPVGYVYTLGSKKWIKTASGFERDYTYTGTDIQQVQSAEDLAFSEASATLDTPPVVEDTPVVVELFDTVDSKIVIPRLFEITEVPSEIPPFETISYQIDAYLNEVNKFYDGEPIKIVFGDYEISGLTAIYNESNEYDIIISLAASRQNDISALNNAIQSQINVIQIISTAISNTQFLVPSENKKLRMQDIYGEENKLNRNWTPIQTIEELDSTVKDGFYYVNITSGDYAPFGNSEFTLMVAEAVDSDWASQIAIYYGNGKRRMSFRTLSSGNAEPEFPYGWQEAGNDNLSGTNYVMVYGVGTPTENAAELQAAYNAAKNMPRYLGAFENYISTFTGIMAVGSTFEHYDTNEPSLKTYYKVTVATSIISGNELPTNDVE